MQLKIYALQVGSGQPHVYARDLKKLQIPIPCPEDPEKSLAIQARIVKILDALSSHIEALKQALSQEAEARGKQYRYYRDKLLSFEAGEAEWKTLGEVVIIKTGQVINKQMIESHPGDYPVISSGRESLGFINRWNTDNDPIGITTRGAGVGSITWQEGKYFRGGLNYSVTIKADVGLETRYLYHLLLKMQPNIHALCVFTGIPALNAGNLKQLKLPIPPLAEQARIVSVLDRFDALAHSLEKGLPYEIQLRQKQYEYYRDWLLSFSRPDSSHP